MCFCVLQTTLGLYYSLPCHLPEYFDKVDEFIPERWIRGDQLKGDIHPFIVTPFGHGPRMCLGK